MSLPRPLVERLIKDKALAEKNEWYKFLLKEVQSQIESVRKNLGDAKDATLEKMKFEQGRISGMGWLLRRPDKLMDELIQSLEKE